LNFYVDHLGDNSDPTSLTVRTRPCHANNRSAGRNKAS
jgi:hypothetical protein